MQIREVFARNLRKARHEKGLSQEALAYEAEVDRTYISALERGVYGATIDMVDKLAAVLNVERVRCFSGRQGSGRADLSFICFRSGSALAGQSTKSPRPDRPGGDLPLASAQSPFCLRLRDQISVNASPSSTRLA